MNDNGINNVVCEGSVAAVTARLEQLLPARGLKIFSRIDQAAEAAAVGLALRPMVLIIFGDPKSGTPLMQQYPSLAVDLPLKALVWESADGKVWLSYNRPEFLQARHGLAQPAFQKIEQLLQSIASPAKP